MNKCFHNIFVEISGVCNAHCPYCMSGRYRAGVGKFIDPSIFEQIMKRLAALDLLNRDAVVGLYNWGEPFLHPQLHELVEIANRAGCAYSFSTNASKVPAIDSEFVKGLREIIFSMPGFSQASYDRIHRFNFATILHNIVEIVTKTRACGYKGLFRIHFHVYQFNLCEIPLCGAFCRENGIHMELHYAILNNWDHLWAYVDNKLPLNILKDISQDLFSFRLRELSPDTVETYRCPQYGILPIDPDGEVLLCCQVPSIRDYSAGNLLHDEFQNILRFREQNPVCEKCIARGMARYLNSALPFHPFWVTGENDCKKRLKRMLLKIVGLAQRARG